MRGTSAICLMFLMLGLGLAVGISAQEGDGHDMPMGPPEEMKQMERFNGVWDVEVKFRMDPSQDWQVSQAIVTYKMILDGAAQQMDYQGELMGMKFAGIGVTCYNRQTKTWQNTWIDNMSAAMGVYEGGPEGDTIVFSGTDTMNGVLMYTRMTHFNITDDRFEWKMENSTDGENYSINMTTVYTKR